MGRSNFVEDDGGDDCGDDHFDGDDDVRTYVLTYAHMYNHTYINSVYAYKGTVAERLDHFTPVAQKVRNLLATS